MKKFLMILFILAVSQLVIASNNTPNGTVNRIHFWQGHSGALITHEYTLNPDNCARQDAYILKQSHPFFSELYSLILAAHMSNKRVQLSLSDCHEGFPVIVHIYSYKSS